MADLLNLTLGFSPCPNDTFMFDALVNGRINTTGINFHVEYDDVESLNRRAINHELDISKISFAVYDKIKSEYELLTSGSALGNGVGPLLISKNIFFDPEKQIKSVAIPGKNTTAYYLFKIFYPELTTVKEMVFSDIENAVLDGHADAGVIIHENRFTYEAKGLVKISDLGDLWQKKTGEPIPLGGIVIRRNLSALTKQRVNNLLRESIKYAFANPEASSNYVKSHAQEMSDEVRKKHIQLYVNEFSLDLGMKGRAAILKFLGYELNRKKCKEPEVFIE